MMIKKIRSCNMWRFFSCKYQLNIENCNVRTLMILILSKKEILLIQQSWSHIQDDIEQVGLLMFQR